MNGAGLRFVCRRKTAPSAAGREERQGAAGIPRLHAGSPEGRDGQHAEQDGERQQDHAVHVEAGGRPPDAFRQELDGQDHQRRADRDVDEEDAAPAPVLSDEAAEHRSDDAPDGEDAGEHGEGLVPVPAEVVGHDARRRRHEGPASDGLDQPERPPACRCWSTGRRPATTW